MPSTDDNRATGASRFQSTHWSVVASAAGGCDEAMAELCAAYWKPLYFHVRMMGYDVADAQDLTQSFFARLIEKRLVSSADASRGRFRTFLITSLRRFVINEWKRGQTKRRGGMTKTMSLDFDNAESQLALQPWYDLTPDQLYERQWAIELLKQAFQRLEDQAAAQEKTELFRKLRPCLKCMDDAPQYKELAEELGATTGSLKMTVSRWRKELGRFMKEEIQSTVQNESDVEDELRRLLSVFSSTDASANRGATL